MARKSYGYNQALELLKSGEKIRWIGCPCYHAQINHITVHYPAFNRLRPLLERISRDGIMEYTYILKKA